LVGYYASIEIVMVFYRKISTPLSACSDNGAKRN